MAIISEYLCVKNRYEFKRIMGHSKNNTIIPTSLCYIDNLTIMGTIKSFTYTRQRIIVVYLLYYYTHSIQIKRI